MGTDDAQQDRGKGIICSTRVDLYMPTESQGGDGLCSIGDVLHVKAGAAHGLRAKGLCPRGFNFNIKKITNKHSTARKAQ